LNKSPLCLNNPQIPAYLWCIPLSCVGLVHLLLLFFLLFIYFFFVVLGFETQALVLARQVPGQPWTSILLPPPSEQLELQVWVRFCEASSLQFLKSLHLVPQRAVLLLCFLPEKAYFLDSGFIC
jgi:hypothetical protein